MFIVEHCGVLMESTVLGIHHITAITDDPQHNIDFYAGVLGLRLVKKTVNFDVPDTYHFIDLPGFTIDEEPEEPGTHLKLPPWLEPQRPTLERNLPPVSIPYIQTGVPNNEQER